MNYFLNNAFFLLLISVILFSGCSSKQLSRQVNPMLYDGKYDSEFPYQSTSKELKEVLNSVKKIQTTVYYDAYLFGENDRITERMVEVNTFRTKTELKYQFTNTAIGTATIISHDAGYVGLLTCAHTVDFPDTLYMYRNRPGLPYNTILEGVAFVTKQENVLFDALSLGRFEILAKDRKRDIAVLGTRVENYQDVSIPVLKYPTGKAKELDWGSFVYMVGYPKGYKMVTRGIVSDPDRKGEGDFLIDGLFNRGLSGGLVLALRDGIPNFELVGMANAASANYDYFLVPRDVSLGNYYPNLPYRDTVFVERKTTIEYGITQVIPVEAIITFLKENHTRLMDLGYNFSYLYRRYDSMNL